MAKPSNNEAPDFVKKPEQVRIWERKGLMLVSFIFLTPIAFFLAFLAVTAIAVVEAVAIQVLLILCVGVPLVVLGALFKPVKQWYTALARRFTAKHLYPIAPIEYLQTVIKDKEDTLESLKTEILKISAVVISAQKLVDQHVKNQARTAEQVRGLNESHPDYDRMARRLALDYDRASNLLRDATERLGQAQKSERIIKDKQASCDSMIEQLKSDLETYKQKWELSKAISGAADSARDILSGMDTDAAQWEDVTHFIEQTDSLSTAKVEALNMENSGAQLTHAISMAGARSRFDEIRRNLNNAPEQGTTGVRVEPNAEAAPEVRNPFEEIHGSSRTSGSGKRD